MSDNIKLSDILGSRVKIGLHNSQKSNISQGFWGLKDNVSLHQPSGYSYIKEDIEIPDIDEIDINSKYISLSVAQGNVQFDVSQSSEVVDSYFLMFKIKGSQYIVSGSMDRTSDLTQVDTIKISNIGFSVDNIEFDEQSKDMIAREII